MDAIAQRIIQRTRQQTKSNGIANDPIAQRVLARAKGEKSQIPAGVSRETFERSQRVQKPTGASGLYQNFKTDFGSFAKGMIGLGKEAFTNPIDTGGKVYGVGKELVKGIPSGAKAMANAYKPENLKKGYESFKQLRQIPLEDQKRALSEMIQKVGENPEAQANPDKRRMAQVGLAILGNYSQYSRPGEKVYNEPFSAVLDAIPALKSAGVGKLAAAGASKARTLPGISKAVDTAQDMFVPGSKLKRAGYANVAEDLQKTGTNMRKAQEGIIKSTVGQFEDLSKAERTQFFDAIDSLRRTPDAVPTSANPRVQAKIDWYMKEELPNIRQMAGYTDGQAPIQNYLHHLFTPDTETKMGGKLSAPSRGFLKQSKDVEGFSKDPVVSIAGVKSKAATANIKDAFIARVTKKYARPEDTVTEFKNGTILAKDTGEPLIKWKGQYLPKDLGEELLRYEGKGKGIVDTMLTPLRVFNQNWKPLATAVRPRYHLRNIIGNVYNASFVGNANPMRFIEGAAQQFKGHIASNMKEGTFAGQVYKALFKEVPEHKYIKMAAQDDVIGRGFFAADINDLAEVANTTEDFAKAIAKMENPAMIYRIPVLRQWLQASSAIGQAFEDNARLALYIDQLKKGATRVQAKAYVNKHLFDYLNGLGEGDKAIKAIIPFWSWTRFNVPLQYGALWKNPIRNVVAQEFGKPYVQQNEAENPEYQYLPQREKDLGAIKTGETVKDGKVYDKYMRTQGVLPIQDIAKVADPDNAGVSPVFNMVKQGYRYAVPPENPQQNMDYFGKPVESFPGEMKQYMGVPVRGTTKEILQSIPAISEINKAVGGSYTPDRKPDLGSRMETVLSPTSSTLQDREANQRYFYRDLEQKTTGSYNTGYESEFKYAVKSLIQRPDDEVANRNLKTLTALLRQNGFSEQDIQKSIREALKTFRSDMPKRGIKMDSEELMQNLDKIKTKPYFTP